MLTFANRKKSSRPK